jgi:hypothetical protein
MLSKESKIRVLENFYALDFVFFGKSLSEVENCCPVIKEEYLSVKGALSSVMIEMLRLVDHSPEELTENVNTEDVLEMAKGSAFIARENAQKIVKSEKSRINIKTSLREELEKDNTIDVSVVVEEKIREKAFSLAVDNLIVARIIGESENYKNLNEWSGKIIEDSYKILRDSLVESAISILYDDSEE